MIIYDSATFNENDAQWGNAERSGRIALQAGYKKFFNSSGTYPSFSDLGCERTKYLPTASLVFQVDFMLPMSIESQTEAIFGPVAAGAALLAPMSQFPSAYGYINHAAGQPPNVQAFPSGTRAPIKTGQWYTLKVFSDVSNLNCKVYIDGGEYSNFLIEPNNPTDFSASLNMTFQMNVKRLPASSFLAVDNYYVTDTLTFPVPKPRAVDMDSMNFATKEYHR